MADISSIQLPSGNTYDVKDILGRQSIPYGIVTSNSTTVFTATVDGVTQLSNGVCCLIRNNNKQTSESGWTLNINNLGAKPVYNSMADATRDTTIFNKVYTMLFIYDEDRVDGGCWVCYRGYDSNTNTIGYQLRTNSANMPAVQTGYRYRLWFTDADGAGWVPANTSTATNATTARALNTRPIDPFGPIIYCSHNATKSADAGLGTSYQWSQYALNIGYSYMASGFALVNNASVYVKCSPQTNGSAVMQSIVCTLPTTADGYIYIFLGTAYSTTSLELLPMHPVYYHDGTAIRLWTGATGVTSVNGSIGAVTGLQTTSNLVTSILSSSTDTQYPSAKCVYDAINTAIGTAIGGSY